MTALATFAHGLADSGTVLWETPPRVRMATKWLNILREQPDQVREQLREVLRRGAVFRDQVKVSAGGPIIPYLILLDSPSPDPGACISCGIAINGGWRCRLCLMAVYIALGRVIDLVEITRFGADPADEG